MGQLSVDLSAKIEELKTKTNHKNQDRDRVPALFHIAAGVREDPVRRGPVGDPHRLHWQR